jgi:negative regulator of flagellin synthesis FlgM
MKVSNNGNNPSTSSVAGTPSKVEEKSRRSSASAADKNESLMGSARVDVSDRAQQMQKAKDIAGHSSVDEAKVARLQKMIDDGKYKVDADAVADRLVDAHMSFPE